MGTDKLHDLNGWKQDEHWKVINGGSTVISTTPEQLWGQACNYFKWVDENPLTAKRTLTSGKTQGEKVEVEFKRPYTIKGFCLHAGITERYLTDLQNVNKDSQWVMVVEKILMIIYNQNLEGAIVDLYNPVIVSKVLNLDKGEEEQARVVRVEIVESKRASLPTSENEVLKNLDFGKLETLKSKEQAAQEQAKDRNTDSGIDE